MASTLECHSGFVVVSYKNTKNRFRIIIKNIKDKNADYIIYDITGNIRYKYYSYTDIYDLSNLLELGRPFNIFNSKEVLMHKLQIEGDNKKIYIAFRDNILYVNSHLNRLE